VIVVFHLVKRFATSLSAAAPGVRDEVWAESFLLEGELALWRRLDNVDRRHAIQVARRFMALGSWSRDEMAAALLHDIGKTVSGLSTLERVGATILGGRTARWRDYRDHERIGVDLCRAAGSTSATLAILSGEPGPVVAALRRADRI
jgi:hypothetical protein